MVHICMGCTVTRQELTQQAPTTTLAGVRPIIFPAVAGSGERLVPLGRGAVKQANVALHNRRRPDDFGAGRSGLSLYFNLSAKRLGTAASLTRFFQLRQASLRLIRVRRGGIFFYDLPIKFRRVGPVVLLLFQLRGIV